MELPNINYTTIEQLTSGLNIMNWIIKARILKVKPPKIINKEGREINLQEIELIDSSNQEISGIFFNEAIEEHQHKLIEQQVLTFSNGKFQKNKFNNKSSITFNKYSSILPQEDSPQIPTYKYDFKKIEELGNLPKNTILDCYGVVNQIEQIQNLTLKNGGQQQKQSIVITNQSLKPLELIFWGDSINLLQNYQQGDYICIKEARLGSFKNQQSLTIQENSQICKNQLQVQEIQELKAWYDQQNKPLVLENESQVTQQQTTLSIEQQCLKLVNNKDFTKKIFAEIKCSITTFNENKLYYLACTNQNCSKKVIYDVNSRKYKCDGKNCTNLIENPIAKYIAFLKIHDADGYLWCNAYNDVMEQILGTSAENIRKLKEFQCEENEQSVQKILNMQKNKEFVFKTISTVGMYQDKPQIKHVIYQVVNQNQEEKILQNQSNILKQIEETQKQINSDIDIVDDEDSEDDKIIKDILSKQKNENKETEQDTTLKPKNQN